MGSVNSTFLNTGTDVDVTTGGFVAGALNTSNV